MPLSKTKKLLNVDPEWEVEMGFGLLFERVVFGARRMISGHVNQSGSSCNSTP